MARKRKRGGLEMFKVNEEVIWLNKRLCFEPVKNENIFWEKMRIKYKLYIK